MPNTKEMEEATKLEKERLNIQKKMKLTQDKIKALDAKNRLLTKQGRNRYLFSLGLKVSAYFEHPEFLTDDDFDEIIIAAFGEPDVYDLIRRREKQNMEQYLKDDSGNKSE